MVGRNLLACRIYLCVGLNESLNIELRIFLEGMLFDVPVPEVEPLSNNVSSHR